MGNDASAALRGNALSEFLAERDGGGGGYAPVPQTKLAAPHDEYYSDNVTQRMGAAATSASSSAARDHALPNNTSLSDYEVMRGRRAATKHGHRTRRKRASKPTSAKQGLPKNAAVAAVVDDDDDSDDALSDAHATLRNNDRTREYQSISAFFQQHLRVGLKEQSPDSAYLRQTDVLVEKSVDYYRSVMERFCKLDELRNAYSMKYVQGLLERIAMSEGTIEHSQGGDAHGDIITKTSMLTSLYSNLSSTVMALDHGLQRAIHMRQDLESASKYGTKRGRFRRAPSFIDSMCRMRDMFMIGRASESMRQRLLDVTANVVHPFSAALANRQNLEEALALDEKNKGKRTRMNGCEYMCASWARYANERFDDMMDHVASERKTPLFSIVVPKRVLVFSEQHKKRKSREDDSDGGGAKNTIVYNAYDGLETRRLLLMHYALGDEHGKLENDTHVLTPVDDALVELLVCKDDKNALPAYERLAELICENARIATQMLHSSSWYERHLVHVYVSYVAPSVIQKRMGSDSCVLNVRHRRRCVGADVFGPYPPGQPLATVERTLACVCDATNMSQCVGSTVYHTSCGDEAIMKNNALHHVAGSSAEQGPDAWQIIGLLTKCTDPEAAKRAMYDIFATLRCQRVTPLSAVYVASGTNMVVPDRNTLREAVRNRDGAAAIPFYMHITCAWYPCLAAFIIGNMRFAPAFDVTLWAKNADETQYKCVDLRIDYFRTASFFSYDSVRFSRDGHDLLLAFDLNVNDFKNNLSHMAPVSKDHNRDATFTENSEALFPIHWRGINVKAYAKRELDEAYKYRQGAYVNIRKAHVYSFVQSQSAHLFCSFVSTNIFDELSIVSPTAHIRGSRQSRARLTRNAYGTECTEQGTLRGHRIGTDISHANDASTTYWSASARYRVMSHILFDRAHDLKEVHELAQCRPCNVRVGVQARDVFEDELTGVECARTIRLTTRISNIDAQKFVAEMMTLDGFWSATSVMQNMSLSTPRFGEYSTASHDASSRRTQTRDRKMQRNRNASHKKPTRK